MNTLTTLEQVPTAFAVLPIAQTIHFPLAHPDKHPALEIYVPDFDLYLTAPIMDFAWPTQGGEVVAKASIDVDIAAVMTLGGDLDHDGKEFWTRELSFKTEIVERTARAEFVASTLIAMLSLTKDVRFQIPESNLNLKLNFEKPLSSISKELQDRQRAYRLMVIERATGLRLVLPTNFTANDVADITYVYHAIVDREFAWPIDSIDVMVPATPDSLARLPPDEQPSPILFPHGQGDISNDKTILGHKIRLGDRGVQIDDAVLLDAAIVRGEVGKGDGHKVKATFISLSSRAVHNFPDAPRLPDRPWSPEIETFINLETQLDMRLAERYHALAAATLKGLTEEEVRDITELPEMIGSSFIREDIDEEN